MAVRLQVLFSGSSQPVTAAAPAGAVASFGPAISAVPVAQTVSA